MFYFMPVARKHRPRMPRLHFTQLLAVDTQRSALAHRRQTQQGDQLPAIAQACSHQPSGATMTLTAPQRQQLDQLQPGDVAVLGIAWDTHSSFLRGAALAPRQIRAALHSGAMNLSSERGLDLSASQRWTDLGDLALPSGDDAALAAISGAAEAVLARGGRLLALGGDHAISLPLLRAYGAAHPDLTVLHIDAHPDLYDELDGDRLSHACPFARALEEGWIGRLVQVGIRTLNPHQRQQAERFGVEIIQIRDWYPGIDLKLSGPLYLSLDLDALDPAYAPGVSHHEPGGLSTRELLGMLHGLPAGLAGADLVELNPIRDPAGITAALAAKLLKELIAQMLLPD
jgi:arginase